MANYKWLVEDDMVALYLALYKTKGLNYTHEEIKAIIPHAGMRRLRIMVYEEIHKGRTRNKFTMKLYDIFKNVKQKDFAFLTNNILEHKERIRIANSKRR